MIQYNIMAFFTLKELVDWLGLTVFEIFLHSLGLLVFTLLLVLRLEGVLHATYWQVFSPLFICDGLGAYFCVIVFVRQCRDKEYRLAAMRLLSSLSLLVCSFMCKFLLCQRLAGGEEWSYGEVFAPVFVALQVLMIRACQVH